MMLLLPFWTAVVLVASATTASPNRVARTGTIEVRLSPGETYQISSHGAFSTPRNTNEYDIRTERYEVNIIVNCKVKLPCDEGATMRAYHNRGDLLEYCSKSSGFEEVPTVTHKGNMMLYFFSGHIRDSRYSCNIEAGPAPTQPPTTAPAATTITTTTTTPPPPVIPSGECPCGRRFQERIVNGEDAMKGEFPWQVSLQERQGKAWAHFCGASLVSKRFIITAAHCLQAKDLDTSGYLGTLDPTQGGVRYTFDRIWAHEEFDKERLYNDISLARFEKEVYFTNDIFPVCLPKRIKQEMFADKVMEASGYGSLYTVGPYSKQLKKINLKGITNKKCVEDFEYEQWRINEGMLCALEKDVDTCKGDSGGPLVWTSSEKVIYLAGVTSWGYLCANPLYPGVFTRVTHFLDWIEYKSEGLICSR